MRELNYFLCLVMCFCTLSQSTLSISGKVATPAGDPLAFATVGVIGSPHGTVTNDNGEFAFYLPDSYVGDTLSISYVGFKTYKSVIKQTESPLLVSLQESIVVLDEIVVNAEQLTAKQIMEKALEKLTSNFSLDPFITKWFFHDVRTQNDETVYLAEAAIEIRDPGFSLASDRPKKVFLRGVRASKPRINGLLSSSYANSRNMLLLNLGHNYWLARLKQMVNENEFSVVEVLSKGGKLVYLIRTEQLSALSALANKYSDMKYKIVHQYQVNTETYAIHKVEHLEYPIDSKYIGIEPPYEGDTLFYSKKGWNQVIEFEEYKGQMYLKYNDVSYAFDIVDEKNDRIYLDMIYQYTFITTEIETRKSVKPEGVKMNKNKPLLLQASYDPAFWKDPSNTKLVPLTQKQIKELERYQPLEEQFRSEKNKAE